MSILINISLILGHSLLFYSKQESSPSGVVDDCKNEGPKPTDPAVNYAQMMESLRYNIGPLLQAYQSATRQQAPLNAATDQQIFNTVGRQNAQTGASIDNALLRGTGGQNVSKTIELDRLANPEFYATRELASRKQADLLNGMDPNKLSGSESAELERFLNQDSQASGTAGTGSNTAAIGGALTFGSALAGKKSHFANTLNQANNFLNSSKSGIDVFKVATNKSSNSGMFPGTSQIGQQAAGLSGQGMGLAGQSFGQYQQLRADRPDALGRTTEVLGSL